MAFPCAAWIPRNHRSPAFSGADGILSVNLDESGTGTAPPAAPRASRPPQHPDAPAGGFGRTGRARRNGSAAVLLSPFSRQGHDHGDVRLQNHYSLLAADRRGRVRGGGYLGLTAAADGLGPAGGRTWRKPERSSGSARACPRATARDASPTSRFNPTCTRCGTEAAPAHAVGLEATRKHADIGKVADKQRAAAERDVVRSFADPRRKLGGKRPSRCLECRTNGNRSRRGENDRVPTRAPSRSPHRRRQAAVAAHRPWRGTGPARPQSSGTDDSAKRFSSSELVGRLREFRGASGRRASSGILRRRVVSTASPADSARPRDERRRARRWTKAPPTKRPTPALMNEGRRDDARQRPPGSARRRRFIPTPRHRLMISNAGEHRLGAGSLREGPAASTKQPSAGNGRAPGVSEGLRRKSARRRTRAAELADRSSEPAWALEDPGTDRSHACATDSWSIVDPG